MNRSAKAVGLAALVLVVGIVMFLITSSPTPESPSDVATLDAGTVQTQDAAADSGIDDPDQSVSVEWIAPEPGPGELVALVEGDAVPAHFRIGAAGVYPPVEFTGKSVALPEPARPISGEPVRFVELYAASGDTDHAFWGDVSVDSDAVALEPAGTIEVSVVDPTGSPVQGANVRLARQSLGLVVLDRTTDGSGAVEFARVPAGPFRAWVEAPGYPSKSLFVDHGEHTIALQTGSPVSGAVMKPDGTPAADVLVSVHTAVDDADPFAAPPVEIVKTNLLGEFRLEALAGDRVAAAVASQRFAPSVSGTVRMNDPTRPARLAIELQPAVQVIANVRTPAGDPLRGAVVRWEAADGPWGSAGRSDEAGTARFGGVPADAVFVASLGRFVSSRQHLPEAADGRAAVELVVDDGASERWRYRLEAPDEVTIEHVGAVDSAGARCTVEPLDHRDYMLVGCGEGSPTFELRTNHGLAVWTAEPFDDGATVEVPDPVPFEVTLQGEDNERWDATTLSMVGGRATSAELQRERPNGGELVVSGRAYPGDWRFTVSNARIGMLRFVLAVAEEPVNETFELVELERLRVRIVDRYAAPVTGAYVMLFDGERLVDVSRSAGQLPVEFRVRPPFDGTLLAVDPRRGEGVMEWGTADGVDEARVRLRDRVLFHRVPSSRPTPESLSELLGVRLVESDSGYLLDVPAGAAAADAGLRRGDLFVTAWAQDEGLRVVVYRRGDGYVDVSVP